jgi:hypothetical protein
MELGARIWRERAGVGARGVEVGGVRAREAGSAQYGERAGAGPRTTGNAHYGSAPGWERVLRGVRTAGSRVAARTAGSALGGERTAGSARGGSG